MNVETTFHIWSDGDSSVGIPGGNAEVTVWVDKNDPEQLAFVREQLENAFKHIWDERKVYSMTEEELKKLNDTMDKLESED